MKKILFALFAFSLVCSCDFLEPTPSGNYTEENVTEYPLCVKGWIDSAYDSIIKHYGSFYFTNGEAACDNAVYRDHSNAMWQMSQGTPVFDITYHDIFHVWNECYGGINMCNLFLHDNVGYNTRYLEDQYSNDVLRGVLQGDAYGLRAYFHFMLMRLYSGEGPDGQMLGVPLMTKYYEGEEWNEYVEKRATFDETIEQILRDCDSALVYLPLANKDFLRETNETTVVTGAIRHRKLDRIAITAVKAFTYLAWASPAFSKNVDEKTRMERYDMAAKCAYEVFNHKMTKEYYRNVAGGYDPADNFLWSDSESPEIIFVSQGLNNHNVERDVYPSGFSEGEASFGPSQDLVDAYPTATGYPIDYPDRSKSGYDPEHPYEHRDPRFYSDIYYDGRDIVRQRNGEVMYTFNIADNGKDAPGQSGCTSPTGYYIKKFTYTNYNLADDVPDNGYRSVFYLRVNQMLMIFAEAANQVVGPDDESRYGMSAKRALKYIRAKKTVDGENGLGRRRDPYLDEVAAQGKDAFDALVRNEWRIEFCFEGQRYFDLHRWGLLDKLNQPVRGVSITTDASGVKHYTYPIVDERHYPSLWFPMPYREMRLSSEMVQNKGWEFYK